MRELRPLNPASLMSGRDAQRGAVTTLGVEALHLLGRDAQPAAAPAADAAMVAELEALRTRCAELEARIEVLESSDTLAAADTFDVVARLAALEAMMTQARVRTLADNDGWQ